METEASNLSLEIEEDDNVYSEVPATHSKSGSGTVATSQLDGG